MHPRLLSTAPWSAARLLEWADAEGVWVRPELAVCETAAVVDGVAHHSLRLQVAPRPGREGPAVRAGQALLNVPPILLGLPPLVGGPSAPQSVRAAARALLSGLFSTESALRPWAQHLYGPGCDDIMADAVSGTRDAAARLRPLQPRSAGGGGAGSLSSPLYPACAAILQPTDCHEAADRVRVRRLQQELRALEQQTAHYAVKAVSWAAATALVHSVPLRPLCTSTEGRLDGARLVSPSLPHRYLAAAAPDAVAALFGGGGANPGVALRAPRVVVPFVAPLCTGPLPGEVVVANDTHAPLSGAPAAPVVGQGPDALTLSHSSLAPSICDRATPDATTPSDPCNAALFVAQDGDAIVLRALRDLCAGDLVMAV